MRYVNTKILTKNRLARPDCRVSTLESYTIDSILHLSYRLTAPTNFLFIAVKCSVLTNNEHIVLNQSYERSFSEFQSCKKPCVDVDGTDIIIQKL